jgi:oligopeptide/dipeptide ABC transporter ATP-binding protein
MLRFAAVTDGERVNDRQPLLSVRDLVVEFDTPAGTVKAVDGVSYDVYPGEVLGIVGESGSGKSVSTMAMLGLVPQPPGRVLSGEAHFRGKDLLSMRADELRRLRGGEIGVVFQDPMTSLNPVLKAGAQIDEATRVHHPELDDKAVRARSIELMEAVGIPEPALRAEQYPHEFSGGMRQRVLVAMAIANRPALLIADEPTTALDVTIQAQILRVLKGIQAETNSATILITHDLGLVAELADRVLVMYAGRAVEITDVFELFTAPRHPYTVGLMSSLPRVTDSDVPMRPIPGQPPSLVHRPSGCAFHPRCRLGEGRERCRTETPALAAAGASHLAACHYSDEVATSAEPALPGGGAR